MLASLRNLSTILPTRVSYTTFTMFCFSQMQVDETIGLTVF